MVVIKLKDGSIWVHSPVELDSALDKSVTQLGRVRHVVAPNYEHVKFTKSWVDYYADATAYGCPGMQEKYPDIGVQKELLSGSDEPYWKDEIDY
eukprot:gene38937-51202_t